MLSNSTLHLIFLSSSLSASGWSSKASPCLLLILPLIVKRLVFPVEFARRERVLRPGEEFGEFLVSRGASGVSAVKLVLRGILSIPLLSSLGNERRFSSSADAGEAERGESRNDIDTVRLFDGRIAPEVSCDGVGGWLAE